MDKYKTYKRQTLQERLAAGPLSIGNAFDTFDRVVRIMAVVHRGGKVHGNLTPANVIFTEAGGVELTEPVAQPGVNARAEVWALGALMYEMMTGIKPSPDAKAAPPPIPALATHPHMARIIERCLQNDPNARYASADAVEGALGALRKLGPDDEIT